ncbi:MAG: ribose-5-phosphate isomerase RpiA [Trueperaceae bacterium]
MTPSATTAAELKRAAALAAVDLVESSSVVGLGTGSTAQRFIEELGLRLADGRLEGVQGVATSVASERLARAARVPLVELPPEGVGLAVDGMDEVDDELRAIKGLGGALTREKIVAASAKRFVLVGDSSKRVKRLAEHTPIPVEVLHFGWRRTARLLEDLGLEPAPRLEGDALFVSDNGHPILDCRVRQSVDLEELAERMIRLPGVIEHGLFLEQAQLALVASSAGVEELRRRT